MPSNTSASMFGGAGGRGSRASVASLEGLRNVLRYETDRDSAPPRAVPRTASPANAAPAAPPPVPADDKQTLRGLNDRLSGYLDRVRQLQEENRDLEKQIDDIMAKRKTPEGRNWDKVQERQDALKKQIKDITMDNAKLLLQIDNTKLANDDFNNKLDDETKAREELEKDLENLRNAIEDTKINQGQTKTEIDLVKDEIARVEREHKHEVDDLCEKIKNSEVNVEIESKNVDLAQVVNNTRIQYDNLAKKNLQETEDWYNKKFDNIKVEEAQNVEAAQSGKSELKDLLKQKKILEIQIQTQHSRVNTLEETLRNTKAEYNQRLGPHNQVIHDLESELKEMRAQVEQQMETNKNLLCVKMKLEQEINNYQQLIHGITTDSDSLEFALEEALHSDQQRPEENQEAVKEAAALVKEESAPFNKSTPPKLPEDAPTEEEKAEKANLVKKKKTKNAETEKDSSSSSSSSSESKSEDKNPKTEGKKTKA